MWRVTDRVVVEASKVSRRRLLQAPALLPHSPAMVETADEVGKSAAGMWQANFKLRKAIEESAKNYVGGGDRRIERIPQKVMQIVARQALSTDNIERMEKDWNSQGVNPLEDREERRVGQLLPADVRAEIDAAATKLRDSPLRLHDSEFRILHGQGGESNEPVRMDSAGLSHRVVDEPGKPQTESAISPVDHWRHK